MPNQPSKQVPLCLTRKAISPLGQKHAHRTCDRDSGGHDNSTVGEEQTLTTQPVVSEEEHQEDKPNHSDDDARNRAARDGRGADSAEWMAYTRDWWKLAVSWDCGTE